MAPANGCLREMQIVRYLPTHKQACLSVFASNVGRYFADYEQAEFAEFLVGDALTSDYFVGLLDEQVVACGGFAPRGERVVMTWGMVQRDWHGQELGRQLTEYRLSLISQHFPKQAVELETSQHTQGFYAKQGFRVLKVTKDGFAAGIDLVRMRRD